MALLSLAPSCLVARSGRTPWPAQSWVGVHQRSFLFPLLGEGETGGSGVGLRAVAPAGDCDADGHMSRDRSGPPHEAGNVRGGDGHHVSVRTHVDNPALHHTATDLEADLGTAG